MESLEGVGKTTTASSFKSWALQTEESYQLQLALALRLSSQAASAVDPNFLVFDSAENATDSVETLSHRFWVFAFFCNFEVLSLFLFLFFPNFFGLICYLASREDVGYYCIGLKNTFRFLVC